MIRHRTVRLGTEIEQKYQAIQKLEAIGVQEVLTNRQVVREIQKMRPQPKTINKIQQIVKNLPDAMCLHFLETAPV